MISYRRDKFCSYETNIKYRIQVNYVWVVYYRKKFKQKSINQYDNALNVIKEDLHTIVNEICNFYD